MKRTKIAGIGHYVPERVVTNEELTHLMDTSDEWIIERTGIQERRYATKHKETTATMGAVASRIAIERAGITPQDVDCIVFATLSPDYYFPGSGVLMQRALGISGQEIPCIDIRNQCSGFIYSLQIADQFIKTGIYRNVLVVGSEMHSMGLDYSDTGRNVTVIFGDGAGAVLLQPDERTDSGILTTKIHADGTHAEELAMLNPGSHGGFYGDIEKYGFPEGDSFGGIFFTPNMHKHDMLYPQMNGQFVFKMAVQKFPEVIMEVLTDQQLQPSDIDLLVPHQANLRISQFVQKKLGLSDHQVYNNIQRYGNTTAASIPIALSEAWEEGKVKDGNLVCLAAFGSGFTWGASLIRW